LIYICIPALDEAHTVGVLLWRVRQVMVAFGRDFHVLVLDDGSRDGTSAAVDRYAAVMPLTLLRHARTEGYAPSVERLLREAVERSTHPRRDIAVVMQGDFTEPPEEIPALVKRMEGGADVVAGVVAAAEGETSRGLRWSRRGLPWLLSRAALPAEIRDPFSGFRAYRVQTLRRALAELDGRPLLTASGWAANAELLLRVAPHARRLEAMDISLRYTRRERDSRFRAVGTLMDTWRLARTAPRRGPAPAAAMEGAGDQAPRDRPRKPRRSAVPKE
jgi:glycosyltransferase involved in cell wall biosynthesis